MRVFIGVFVVLSVAWAGCTEQAAPTSGLPVDNLEPIIADVYGPVRDILKGIPCEAAQVGAETSENLKKLAGAPFGSGGHAELDIHADLAVVSTYGGKGFELTSRMYIE